MHFNKAKIGGNALWNNVVPTTRPEKLLAHHAPGVLDAFLPACARAASCKACSCSLAVLQETLLVKPMCVMERPQEHGPGGVTMCSFKVVVPRDGSLEPEI